MRINNIEEVNRTSKINLYNIVENRTMGRLSDAVIVNNKGKEVAKLDTFERGKLKAERLVDIYYNMQKDISAIQSLENILNEKEAIIVKMKDFAKSALKEEDREEIQSYFDYWTKRLDEKPEDTELLTVGFYDDANNDLIKRIKSITGKRLGLENNVFQGKIGKITIRSRVGNSVRVSIMHGGNYDKEINIDTDKNTGDILIGLRGEDSGRYMKYSVTNEDIKLILNKLGYEVIIDKGNEKNFAEIGSTLLGETKELIPLNISTTKDIMSSLDSLDSALDMIDVGRRDLEHTEVGLKSILSGLDFLSQKRFESVDEAITFIDNAKIELVERPIEIRHSDRFDYNRERIEKLLKD